LHSHFLLQFYDWDDTPNTGNYTNLKGVIKVFPPKKRTRPEAHPITIVPFLTIDVTGRYSGGSQRTFLPFQVIQDLLPCRQYPDQFGVRIGSKEP
jgi:hypothetical protein